MVSPARRTCKAEQGTLVPATPALESLHESKTLLWARPARLLQWVRAGMLLMRQSNANTAGRTRVKSKSIGPARQANQKQDEQPSMAQPFGFEINARWLAKGWGRAPPGKNREGRDSSLSAAGD